MASTKSKTIINYLSDFLDYLEIEKGLADKSQKNYARFLNDFFKWLGANKLEKLNPGGLSADHIWKYRVNLSRRVSQKTKAPLKKTTQNLYLVAIRALLEFFEEKNITSLSPTRVKLAKDRGDKEVKFLNLEEIEKLLNAPDTETPIGLRDRAILEAFFSTGLRVEELVNLNLDQFKFGAGSGPLEVAISGKGGKVRTVYFSERAILSLKRYIAKRHDAQKALFINYWRPAGQAGASRRLTVKSIDDIVKKYVKIAGLPVMATPHTIRHSFATDLLAQGVDLRLVQEFLGHRNIATTQIYTHVTKKQLKDIHAKLHGGRKLKG
jgi:site-specific recombinase XerD